MRACPLLLAAVLAGCGTAPPPAPSATAASPSAVATSPSAAAFSPSAPASPPRSVRPKRTTSGWEITVYYTAVEKYHDGEPTQVTGCPRLECSNGDDDLGTYPAGFVEAVEEEGTGRTSSGKYLNWSHDVGFWLDSAPRSSDGNVLTPWVSAAADPDVLPHGTRFTVAACGTQEDGSRAPSAVCTALRKAAWRITDEFTPGLGGPKHLDAYIGPETGPGFTDSEWYLTLVGARLALD
ncbi:hypothetical protein OHA21_50340 [Actinoplanes sp. NBC_00393]|uniref:hypothetical protein n=1 Tax=Actinoplanes sp. NBC_00393 TaxID=2975953 RepID=UPI002E1F83A3